MALRAALLHEVTVSGGVKLTLSVAASRESVREARRRLPQFMSLRQWIEHRVGQELHLRSDPSGNSQLLLEATGSHAPVVRRQEDSDFRSWAETRAARLAAREQERALEAATTDKEPRRGRRGGV